MKKQIDTKKILSAPKQSLGERWLAWGLKKASVAAMFSAVFMWINKAFAGENGEWKVQMGKVTEAFQPSRKMIFIISGFVLLVLLILSLFKKLRWRWFFIFVALLILIALAGLVIDYITGV